MAVSQDVILRVLAQVADAVQGLEQVREEVRLLVGEVKANSPVRFELQIGEDLARLKELQTAFESTLATLRQGSTTGVKIDLSGIEAQLKELSAHVKAGVAEIKAGFEGLSKIPTKAPPLSEKFSEEFRKFQADLRKLESQFQGAVNRLNVASRGVTFDPISRSATLARDKVRIAAENMVEFLSKIPPAVQRDEAAFGALQAKITALRIETERLSKIQVVPPGGVPAAASLSTAMGTLEKAFGLAKVAGQLFFASIIAQKLVDLGKSAVQAASDIQILKGQLDIFVGGPQEAADALSHLREVADSVGINFLTMADSFQKFLVPAQSAGFTLKQTQEVFDAIAIASAGAGKSTEQTSAIFEIFAQVMQKGVIQAEELVKQFANQGIPATSLLAAAYGKTTAEVRKMTAEHQILARDGIPALAAEMLKVYGPAALKNIESFRSENERFANAVLDLKKAFGDELLPVLVETLQLLKELGDGDFAKGIGGDVAFLIAEFNSLLSIINGIRDADLTSVFTGQTSLIGEFIAQLIRAQKLVPIVAAEIAEALRLVPEGFADGIRAKVDEAIDKLRGISKEARNIGRESRAGSEDAAEGVDDLESHWKGLYDNLKKQQADHQKNSAETDEKVTKKLQAELKKREGFFRGFFESIAELSNKEDDALKSPSTPATPSKVTGPTFVAGDSSALDKLKQDLAEALAAKRELALQPLTDPEDSTQVDALSVKIRTLEDQIKSFGVSSAAATGQAATGLAQTATATTAATTAATALAAAFTDQVSATTLAALNQAAETSRTLGTDLAHAAEAGAFLGKVVEDDLGKKALEALRKLIVESGDFARVFGELGPKTQASIAGIIGSFESAARSGAVTREQISAFGLSLLKAFREGGLVGAQFATQLESAFGSVQGSAVSLVDVLKALAAGSLRAVGSGAEDAADSVGVLGGAAATSTAQIDRLLERTDAAAAGFIQAHGDSEQLKEGLFQVGLASTETSVKLHGVEIGLAKAKDGFIGVRTAAGELGPNLLDVGKGADAATAGAEKLAATPPPKALSEGLDQTAKAADSVKAPLEAVATAAEKLGTAGQAEGVGKLGEALATVSGPAAAVSAPLGQVADAASRLAESVGKLVGEPGLGTIAAQLTPLLVPLQQLAEPAQKLGAALAELGRATSTIKAEGIAALAESGAKLAAVVDPAGQAVAALTPLSDIALALGTNFGTLNTNAGNVATQLAAIGTAATALATAVGDPALAAGLDTLGTSLAAAAPNLAVVANDVDRLGKALEATKAAIPEVATGIDQIAKSVAAPEVKAGLGDLATAIEKIEKGATGAATGLKSIGESLGGISTSASKAASGLGELVKAIDVRKISSGADAVGRLGSASATAATAAANLAAASEDVRANVGAAIAKLDAFKASVVGASSEATKAGPIFRQQLASSFSTLQVQTAKVVTDLDTIKQDLQDIGTVGAGQLATTAGEARGLAAALREVASAAGAAKAGLAGVKFPTISGGR